MSDMKLFVWANPYPVKYGGSMVIAVARDVDEARKVVATGGKYSYAEYGPGASPNVPLGEPTRIVDLPCAEWHEWSE